MATQAAGGAVTLRKVTLDAREIPPMPIVAGKVVSMLRDPDRVNFLELSRVIASDQALGSRIVKIANSAFFGLPNKINSLSTGLGILGLTTIKNLVLAASVKQVYKRFGLTEKLLWEHSCMTSLGAAKLARELTGRYAEEAFLAGLIHDIGKVVLTNAAPEPYARVMQLVYSENHEFSAAEIAVFGFDHSDVGGLVLAKWDFGDLIVDLVKSHHDFEAIAAWPEDKRRLGWCVALANRMARRAALAGKFEARDDDPLFRRPAEALGLDLARAKEFEARIAAEAAEEMKAFAE